MRTQKDDSQRAGQIAAMERARSGSGFMATSLEAQSPG